MFNFQNTTEQDPALLTPLAQQLMQDNEGIVRKNYQDAFEILQNQASQNLRQPMSSHDCEINQSAFDVANIATEVLTRFWDRYHR